MNSIASSLRTITIHHSFTLFALLALTILASSGSQVCQKLAATNSKDDANFVINKHLIFSVFLLAISLGSWLMVLARMDVSIAYPLLSANYVVVLVIAKFYFGEVVPVRRWIGTVIIFAGICMLLSGDL